MGQCSGGGCAGCRGVREQLDETLKYSTREVQQQAKAGFGAMVSGASSFTTPVGRATKDK